MAMPNPHPSTTLAQWRQIVKFDALSVYLKTLNDGGVPAVFTDEIQSYYVWEANATAANEAFYSFAQLELIADNTTGLFDQIGAAGDAVVDATLFAEGDMKEFLTANVIPLLGVGGVDYSDAIDRIFFALQSDVGGGLRGLNNTAEFSLIQQIEGDILQANVTAGGLERLALTIAQGLAALTEATGAQGGQSLDEWLQEVTPHSIPPLTNKVFTVEGVTPFMKMGEATIIFLIEKLAILLGPLLKGALKGADSAAPLFKPLIDPVLDGVEKRLSRLRNVAPHEALPLAREFLSDAFTNGLRARLTAILVEKGGDQVKNLGVQQISGLIAELAGFSQLAEAIWGTALKVGIGRPAEYQMNAMSLSKIPSEGTLIEAATERKVSVDALRELLKFHGYADNFVSMMVNTMWTDPRLREIILLASDASVNEDDIRHWLLEAGYDDTDIDRFTPIVIQQSNRGHRQALTSEIMINLGEGFLDEEDAEAQFDRLRYTEEAKRLLLDTGRLKFRREVIQAHITELEQMFQLEQIKEPEFRLALEGLGVRREKVDAIVGKAFSKFIGRVSKEEDAQVDKDIRQFQSASLAALKAQFQAGLIPAGAFEANLVAIGFLPAVAREIVALEQIKLLSKAAGEKDDEAERLRDEIRRARIAAFVELFQDGFINELQFRADLVALGLAPELADALVFREVAKKVELPKPKTATTH